MGVILGSAVVPIALCVTWSKASRTGCLIGACAGLLTGVLAWLVTTGTRNGTVDVVVSVHICVYILPFGVELWMLFLFS